MSRDIRSYFSQKKPPINNDDVIPESPNVRIKSKKPSKKKRVISDDSDEELFTTKKKKTSEDTSKIQSAHKNKHSSKAQSLKEINPATLFGTAPIKRSEPLVKKEKKNTEIGIHSDDEFEQSLLEIDLGETSQKNTHTSKSPVRNNNIDDQKSIKTNGEAERKEKKCKDDTGTEQKAKHFKDNKSNENKKHKKRDFSEFTESTLDTEHKGDTPNKKKKISNEVPDADKTPKIEINHDATEQHNKTKNNKKDNHNETKNNNKANNSLNESVLSDDEKHKRKMVSAALYQNYLNRSGPKHLGAKEMPEGAPNCLIDCTFLLTGVLDSFEREEIAEIIQKYGGCIKSGISKKVTHVLAGDDAGPAKISKAKALGISIIGEDDFLKMISDSVKNTIVKKETKPTAKSPARSPAKSPRKSEKSDKHIQKNDKACDDKKVYEVKSEANKVDEDTEDKKVDSTLETKIEVPQNIICNNNSLMWVDKYKPQNLKQIIGQHSDRSNVKKLTNWLSKWFQNRKEKLQKPAPFSKCHDGAFFKAALLSGPPGVGKTTTVSLVCKELGFDVVEFNASDTRNKSLIKEQIGKLLDTNSLAAYAKGKKGKQAITKKHVLVMDEVDGMAGNEDRGGLQELLTLIKSTMVPIICMCNDKTTQKMRTLVSHCYDLPFSRPRVDQIRAAMMSICYKEDLKVPPAVLTQLIVSAGQDIRQTINLLSLWAADRLSHGENKPKQDAGTVIKDIKMGVWDAARKVFSKEEQKKMSVIDRMDLFFSDYSLMPLFVQENYYRVHMDCSERDSLLRLSRAADSISMGDIVDARIRSRQAWNLLPLQAVYSTVLPGAEMSGKGDMVQFPTWLGHNSRATKMRRLCQEIHSHTRLKTTGSKSSIFLDYSYHLCKAIVEPLVKRKTDGIEDSLNVLNSYDLSREDLDSLVELTTWSQKQNPLQLVDPKVKSAMTRAYNKRSSALPYAQASVKRVRNRTDDDSGEQEDDNDEQEEIDSDPEKDNNITVKKKKSKSSLPSEKETNSNKGKGKKKK